MNFKKKFFHTLICLPCSLAALRIQAEDVLQKTIIDPAPWVDSRAAGMGLAISPVAVGMSAPYYNPAGIGGLHYKHKRPVITSLRFPHMGVAMNESSAGLRQKLTESGHLSDQELAEQVLKAYAGQRQYARISLVPAITINRIFLAYTMDAQIAAVKPSDAGLESELVETKWQEQQGPYLGFSLTDSKRRIYFGLAASYLWRTVTDGKFTPSQLESPQTRRAAFKDSQNEYTGAPVHAGMIWHISDKWRPTLSIVAHNITGTRFQAKNTNAPTLIDEENFTVGFSLSPNTGSWGYLNLVTEAAHLNQPSTAVNKKLRAAVEWTIGNRFGNEAGFSLRAGYNNAGLSYGAGFNLGILHLSAGSFAEDVGKANYRVVERRQVLNFAVDVAAF